MPGTLRYARDYARRRGVDRDQTESGTGVSPVNHGQDARATMNRLYVIESTPTITGANADHRFRANPTEIIKLLHRDKETDEFTSWMTAVENDFANHKGASIIICGEEQPPELHAFAHDANGKLGNVGKTLFYADPIEANSVDQMQSLRELVADIDAGKVETLVIIGGNPAYNTPVDLRLDFDRLEKVKLRAHLNLYNNETSEICHWHINATHYLESWGDARSYDGTATIVQPLIAPLYEGKTAYEVLALFSDNYDQKPYDIVRNYWSGQQKALKSQAQGVSTGSGSDRVQNAGRMPANRPQDAGAPLTGALTANAPTDFESWWRKCLHDGFIPNTALSTKTVSLKSDWASAGGSPTVREGANAAPGYEVVFRPDP